MVLAVDTFYRGNAAKTAAIGFTDWQTSTSYETWTTITEGVEAYTPGEFYKRELPCILGILPLTKHRTVDLIIVDGFVYLTDDNKPGLGAYLFKALKEKVPVIGVAKSNFATLENNKRAVFRGGSKNPLYITAAGIDLDKAAAGVQSMAGPYRIPLLLKILDRLTKE